MGGAIIGLILFKDKVPKDAIIGLVRTSKQKQER